jgi:hypothetical protein
MDGPWSTAWLWSLGCRSSLSAFSPGNRLSEVKAGEMAMAPVSVGYSELSAATGRLAVRSGPVSEGPSIECGAAILRSEGSLFVLFLFLLLGRVSSVPYREPAFIFTGFGWVFLFGHRIAYLFTLSCSVA